MRLSQEALNTLRVVLVKDYGDGFSNNFTDVEIDELGDLFLTALALRLEMDYKE